MAIYSAFLCFLPPLRFCVRNISPLYAKTASSPKTILAQQKADNA
jgi:hypothetical protein